MEELDYYLRIVIGKDAGIIFLCVFGAVLNSIMLYLLLSKKQVRSSVHTVYMVQIALTDLLVCVVWLVLASVETHNLLQIVNDPLIQDGSIGSNGSSAFAAIVAEEEASPAQYRSWRIMYFWYNFHYYTNILLLASMSVERCAAVWKSMRCQRYQYNKKIIIGVSVFMWFVAFLFVLPNLIDPDLIVTDSDSTESVGKTFLPEKAPSEQSDALFEVFRDLRPQDKSLPQSVANKAEDERNYKQDLDILYTCYTILMKAINENDTYARNEGQITVHGCMNNIMVIITKYSAGFEEPPESNTYGPSLEYSSDDDRAGFDLENYDVNDYTYNGDEENFSSEVLDQYEIRNSTTGEVIALNTELFRHMLAGAVKILMHHYPVQITRNRGCDPHISDAARIYVLVVNLVLGFFIPFTIIVFSYVSIAYMIGKRARSRMHPESSETSITRFAHHYLHNHSTANIPLGPINVKDGRHSRARRDSVTRRMSDFVRVVILRKPHSGAENGSYLKDSGLDVAPYGSHQNMPYSSSSRSCEESSGARAKSDNAIQYRPAQKSPEGDKSSEEDPLYDPELQEAIRQLGAVRMRHDGREDIATKANPRIIKKYSFGDAPNDNIPQTIEEHPHEVEGDDGEEPGLAVSNGSCYNDSASPSTRNHAVLLMIQRNSRRESGGSYGSSMDSMLTDQTSLMTSLHDKRYSAATTASALTPPTPIEPNSPTSNQFFPTADDNKSPQHRTQSTEAGYPLLGDHRESGSSIEQQRSPRSQKPGSQLNDVTLQLYRKSLQKKQFDEADPDSLQGMKEDNNGLEDLSEKLVPGTSVSSCNPLKRERYSNSRMTRSKSAPDDKLFSGKLSSKSTARLINEQHRNFNDEEHRPSVSQHPKYHRQNSSASTVFFTRGRTYSTASRGSVGGTNTLRKTMARKNAERHLRVSRTVLAYVIIFSICWLPQRITYLLYVIEALMGASNEVCWRLISGVRVFSFISVLLNPAVYILTQRDFKSYVRNSVVGSRIRRWYAKCSRRRPTREESNPDSRGRPASSNRNGDVEIQVRREPEDPELSGNNRQDARSPYRITSPQRPTAHVRKSPLGGTQEMFASPNGINIRRHDATIDEMKEEEAAAEESLEKEMRRLAEEKRRKDDINKNFLESSEDDLLSPKNPTGSGDKTSSSSSKSESFEQFWTRFLQSGGAAVSPPNGNLTSPEVANIVEPGFPDLEQLGRSKVVTNSAKNGLNETGVLE